MKKSWKRWREKYGRRDSSDFFLKLSTLIHHTDMRFDNYSSAAFRSCSIMAKMQVKNLLNTFEMQETARRRERDRLRQESDVEEERVRAFPRPLVVGPSGVPEHLRQRTLRGDDVEPKPHTGSVGRQRGQQRGHRFTRHRGIPRSFTFPTRRREEARIGARPRESDRQTPRRHEHSTERVARGARDVQPLGESYESFPYMDEHHRRHDSSPSRNDSFERDFERPGPSVPADSQEKYRWKGPWRGRYNQSKRGSRGYK